MSRQRLYQISFVLLCNGYLPGFLHGKIFSGPTKTVCVPVLNCYSCPGALGACPIGALQAVLGRGQMPFYVLGTLTLIGVMLGRAVCGLLCPFGLVQDLLHKLPLPKVQVPRTLDHALRYLKYAVLLILVVLLPAFAVGKSGIAPPYFCEWLCPAGTLGGALPLMATNPSLRALAGALFSWKLAVLLIVLILATLLPRPFCRYLCPLGAFYGLFNRFSLYQLQCDAARCVDCGRCARVCPMAVDASKESASRECIRCGACASACPQNALQTGFRCSAGKEDVLQSD